MCVVSLAQALSPLNEFYSNSSLSLQLDQDYNIHIPRDSYYL